MNDFVIQPATEKDIPLVLSFIRRLAEYERLLDACVTTEAILRQSLFGERRYAEAIIASYKGEPVGFAVYFHNFSTFLGRPGLYLEDLFVVPEMRGRGFGKAILIHLATVAAQRGCSRMEWAVLDWNQPSIDFYKSLGAQPLNDWRTFRLTDAGLRKLASM
jgi:GNAT superfamily N-acetyltransferase